MSFEDLIKRTEGTRFKKGHTTNPGGRRKISLKLIALARESVPDAFKVAREIMLNAENKNGDRLEAAKFLTVYGLGAPPKVVPERDIIDDSADEMGKLTVDELRSLARQSLTDDAAGANADDDSDDDEPGEPGENVN